MYVYIYIYANTHRIHGAGIYANMDGVYWWHMLPYIAAPWILWDITCQIIADFIQATHVDGSIDRPSDPPSPWKLLYLRNQQKLSSFPGLADWNICTCFIY